MERKTLEAMLPEGTDKEVVTKVLDALHGEIGPYKEAAQKAEAELAEKIKEIGEISKKAKSAEEAQNALIELQTKYETDLRERDNRIEQIEFNNQLHAAIKEKGGRDVEAVLPFLDQNALKSSKNRQADILSAVQAVVEKKGYLFEPLSTGQKVDVGTRYGKEPGMHGDDSLLRAAMGLTRAQKEE